jgi:NTE family protein
MICFVVSCGHPHRLIPPEHPDPLPCFFVPEKIRVALVLGSGGVRGMAHVGVIEELVSAGIPIDLIVGCSAGSIVGALYADNPDTDALRASVLRLRTESLLDFEICQCRYGLSQPRSMQKVLDDDLCAENFDELQIPLVIVASDLHSGELVPMGSGDLVKAIEASCSIPFVFVPCQHQGRILVDGGVINPVPARVARDLGAELVIAVDLGELLPRTFPSNLFQVATRSAEIAFMWQNEICTRTADIVIRPKTCGVGAFNDKEKWKIYWAGRRAANEQIPYILECLQRTTSDQGLINWRLIEPRCYTPQIFSDPKA